MKTFLFSFLLLYNFALMGYDRVETPSQKKMRIIINGRVGQSQVKYIESLFAQYLDRDLYDYEFRYTERPKQAIEYSREAVEQGHDVVVAVGGDGTVNEVGKTLIGTNVKLGIIPAGSGNGLARHLQIPTDIKQAILVLNHKNATKIDTIRVNDDYALGTVGFGFDAHIAWKFARMDKRGYRAYKGLVLKEYFGYQPKCYTVNLDGVKHHFEGLLLTVANSSQYGNNYQIVPNANISDGTIELAVLEKPAIFSLYDTVSRVKAGTIDRSKYYKMHSCKEVQIPQQKMIAHIDGEPVYFENGVQMKVLPQSLNVLAP